MDKVKIIHTLAGRLKEEFAGESTGHDWFHLERVWKNAKLICLAEGGDSFICELAALLHDIADHKFVENPDEEAERRINALLGNLGVDQPTIQKVTDIVRHSSFKGGIENKMTLKEGLIVQDADRLDAIGAIGIARSFAYGGKSGSLIYDPGIPPSTFKSAEEYMASRTHTINHFYEKLLRLKDKMNTKTGKELALQRHQYMEGFLNQFYKEWNAMSGI
ncbi:MAG: HD domain-containing protein [Bacteroidetes bacterium]|nr:HD domain-containing protein [Bacteroidota bacterium]